MELQAEGSMVSQQTRWDKVGETKGQANSTCNISERHEREDPNCGSPCESIRLTHRNFLAYKPKLLGPGNLSCDTLNSAEDPYNFFLLWKTCGLNFLFSFYIATKRYVFILTDPRVYKASESWVGPIVECLCYGCTPMFMVALFTITKICKQHKCPSTDSE